ncbi:MAG: isocitrate/isopropylmalate dehydrogenase family protein, partial [Sphaerochaetaceae bacterium]
TILSAKMMLDWLGRKHKDDDLIQASKLIDEAVYQTFLEGVRTTDVAGNASTSEFGDTVIKHLLK